MLKIPEKIVVPWKRIIIEWLKDNTTGLIIGFCLGASVFTVIFLPQNMNAITKFIADNGGIVALATAIATVVSIIRRTIYNPANKEDGAEVNG